MIDLLRPSTIAFEALRIAQGLKATIIDNDGMHTHASLRPLQSLVGLATGAEYNMALIYYCYHSAAHKLGIDNPLISTPYPIAQYEYCASLGQIITQRIFKPSKPYGFIDADTMDITTDLVRVSDIFFIQTKEGLWHCGLICHIHSNVVHCLESSKNGLKIIRRDISQIRKLIRVC